MQYIQIPPLFGIVFTAILVFFPQMPVGVYVVIGIACLSLCIYLCRISYKWEKEWEADQKRKTKTNRSKSADAANKNSTKSSAAKSAAAKSCAPTKTAIQSCRKIGKGYSDKPANPNKPADRQSAASNSSNSGKAKINNAKPAISKKPT